jgi:transketolase
VEPDVQWSTNYTGRNLRFGVREHAMGAMLNGLALHRGFLPYGGTFLIFSDYMRPSIRLAALSKLHVIYIFTHDSIGVGEDGPTHQPVEQLVGLRSVPNLLVFRPADANETTAAWRLAVTHQGGPVALVLSRQGLPILDPARYPQLQAGVARGGYVLEEAAGGAPELVIVATGSEVLLAREAREMLTAEGRRVRVVSLPCIRLFQAQPAAYRDEVIPPGAPLLAVEAGSSLGWRPYVGPAIEVVGLDRFGLSAPGPVAMRELGFSAENVCQRARKLLAGTGEQG